MNINIADCMEYSENLWSNFAINYTPASVYVYGEVILFEITLYVL